MLTRRGFVKLVGIAPVVASCGDNIVLAKGAYFSNDEWDAIDIASETILPDIARAAVVVRYIDNLLSAFDHSPPTIFAGGPNSGRQGGDDDFKAFLPLNRVRELAWRMRVTSWRDQYKQALAMIADQAGGKFASLAPDEQQHIVDDVGSTLTDWYTAFTEHVIEGAFSAPEYGGNDQLVGWKAARYDGDSAPLGHATFDGTQYVDRADQPTSTATPGDTTEAFDKDALQVLTLAALGSGGKQYF